MAIPTHWIALYNDDISYNSTTGHVKFNAFTFGKVYEFNLKETDFKNYIYWIGLGHA